jgi:DNA recombination protein RmuC
MSWILPAGVLLLGLGAGVAIAWIAKAAELRQTSTELQRVQAQRESLASDLQAARSAEAVLSARLEERTSRIQELERELAAALQLQGRVTALAEQTARLQAELESEKRAGGEKLALLEQAETKLREAFQALSAESLRQNNQTFLELAKASLGEFQTSATTDLETRKRAIDELVKPIGEALLRVDAKIQEVEKTRAEAFGSLTQQLKSVAETQQQLHAETSNLVRALRSPSVRGRWGEMTLRRVVELAGMAEYCDFDEQPTADTQDGRLRPDLIVHLPAGKQVVVDAKVPLEAYLKALEAPDEATRTALLVDHARQVRDHMNKLAAKSYWDQFEHTPDHVVMFIPGEVFFFAALQHDPELIEFGVSRNVFVAGPTTLISLLRTVAYGWRQERIAENAQAISQTGRELYDRIATMADHLSTLGRSLDRSVEAYNSAIGSLESRVLVSARRFKDLGAASDELPLPEGIDRVTRQLQAPELHVDE